MTLRPLGQRIVVRPVPMETMTGFGFLLPEGIDEGFDSGVVISKGEKVGDYLREGTRVLHSRNGIQHIHHNGEALVALSEMSVLCAIDDFNVMDDS